jgi:uncharacterized membrane protein YqjE
LTTRDQPVSGPLRRLGASLIALGRIRLELLTLELQEEKERLAAMLVWAVVAALMAAFALVFLAVFVTVALWDTHRLVALGVGTAAFVAVAAYAGSRLQRLLREPAAPLQASIAELRRDSEALRGSPGP